ncbi:hypothetical protein AS188_12995 [Kocuria flava]|uniref:Glycosyltransferase RgtA/B/C/D-like domain-containing protein n=1 Tax=Kocuria flava TaxID=446860 RepID=A0A0U3HSH5_9MICC|nr:DUF6541 family protein [Kocuria flava]ALU40518.1 hypothetical protein AS188_12995 [Kocuria flava]GEO92448.1 hypothetical protein KFL01_17540 [Kocuria flava]
MLTAWAPYAPALLLLLAVLWLPGLALLWAFGQRGGRILLTAPAFSVAVVGVSGVALDLLGIRYDLLSQAGAALVLAAAAWLVGRVLPRGGHAPAPEDRPAPDGRAGATAVGAPGAGTAPDAAAPARPWVFPAAAAVGVAVGAVLLLRRMVSAIGEPEAMAQRWDNIFHLNAIRWIVETGSGSTLTLNRMVDPERTVALYPAAWHQLASLAVPVAGDSVLAAHNLTLLAVAGVVWPASCVFLTRCLVGPSPVAAVVAGAASAGFGLFPYGLMAWGPLFPNILSLVLLPVVLGLLVRLLGPGLGADPTARTPDGPARLRTAASLLVALGALFVSQPNGVLALLVVGVPLVATAWALGLRAAVRAGRRRRTALLAVAAVLAAAVWLLAWNTLTTTFFWAPFTTLPRGVGEALLYGTNGRLDVPWVLVVLTGAGIYAAVVRRRLRWLVVAHLLLAYLYAVAAAGEDGPWRDWLTSGWYTDSHRLAATLPLTALPLAALGAEHLAARLAAGLAAAAAVLRGGRAGGRPPAAGRARPLAYPVAAVLVLAVAVPVSQMGSLTRTTQEVKRYYAWDGPESILGHDEFELLQELGRLTGPGDVVAVNPWNGGSLAWAVAERPVTQYHVEDPEPPLDELVAGIDTAAPGSPACAAAEELGVEWVLDFGTQLLVPWATEPLEVYSGVTAVDPAADPGLAPVAREGGAVLYEVVGCDGP